MSMLKGLLASALLFPSLVLAQEATVREVHDKPAVRGSIIANMLEKHDNPFVLYPYESNYLLYTATSNINKEAIDTYNWSDSAKHDEVKFQLSWPSRCGAALSVITRCWVHLIRKPHGGSSPTVARHRLSVKRIISHKFSPGWATDYSFAGWTLRDVEFGLNHQSNGRSEPTSRSWNRVYARLMAQNGNWLVEAKPRFRISESANDDDNPDITKYMGYYRLTLGYQAGESIFSVRSNYNWNSGYGGAELGWSYPISEHVRFYTQVFSGYGESLIDYNHRQTRVGVGVTLNDLF